MATVEPQSACSLKPAPITSVQPGGGFCMQLELAWGNLRRAWLRQMFPKYVESMLGRRQGQCPNCPHDVIDSRDLKFCRNVCGYWFREEDDLFRDREHWPLARMGLCEALCASLLFFWLSIFIMILAGEIHPVFTIFLVPVLPLWALCVAFFRDPHRTIPDAADALVSPADGAVTHIDEVTEPEFPGGRALRISIFLSVFNVHINRMPRAGRVVELRYYPGAFLDARHPQCGVANEQLWTDVDDAATGRRLRIKQISGKLARRIVCWLKPGAEVQRGQRFGMIKFGSRTEIYLPADVPVDVQVKVGQTVYGGSTVLLRFKDSTGGA
jgi:phosphatidylserine decarboxylase